MLELGKKIFESEKLRSEKWQLKCARCGKIVKDVDAGRDETKNHFHICVTCKSIIEDSEPVIRRLIPASCSPVGAYYELKHMSRCDHPILFNKNNKYYCKDCKKEVIA